MTVAPERLVERLRSNDQVLRRAWLLPFLLLFTTSLVPHLALRDSRTVAGFLLAGVVCGYLWQVCHPRRFETRLLPWAGLALFVVLVMAVSAPPLEDLQESGSALVTGLGILIGLVLRGARDETLREAPFRWRG